MSAKLAQPRIFGAGVRLLADAVAAAQEKTPVWIQAAVEGRWLGHPMNPVVEFTRATFEKVIENFRADPSYSKGADGYGSEPVVPMDYEHASEMNPTSGTIPTQGAAAPGWLLDLEIRDGADGKAQLWALAQLGDTLREQIKAGEYRWTSVAIWPKAKDSVTGKDIGPKLTSLAATNHPFIRGMEPMVAASMSVYGKAETADEVLVGLRSIFCLPGEAGVEAVMGELGKLMDLVANGVKIPGADAEYILADIRNLLGLPRLSTRDEIMGAASAALEPLLQPNVTEGAPSQDPSPGNRQETPMTVPATALSKGLVAVLKCRDTDDAILAAAEKAAKAENALEELMGLLGASTTQELLSKATKLIETSKKVEPLVAALAEANKSIAANDTTQAEQEVEQIAASMKLDADQIAKVKPMLLRERMACYDESVTELVGADGKPVRLTTRKLNDAKLAEFRKNFPLPEGTPPAGGSRQYLTQPIASNGSVQLGGAHTGAGSAGAPGTPAGTSPTTPEHIIKLRGYPGRNDIEKAIAFLCHTVQGFKLRSWHEQCRVAGEYLKSGQLSAA